MLKNKSVDNSDVHQALMSLREDIDKIDDAIMTLLARRHDVIGSVAALKKENNIPIYHPAREEDLISRRRQQGKVVGLNPDYIEEIFRTVISHSRLEQTNRVSLKGIFPEKKILIIGGRGGMGRYFEECFKRAGYLVRILDKDDWPDVIQLCNQIDLVIVSVPIDVTCKVITRIGPYIPQGSVLCDVTSIKEKPLEEMLNIYSGPVIGLHPLFGPSTSSLDKQIIVATPGRGDSACQWVLDQFCAWGAVVVYSTAIEHDEIMNIVQALRHFATFAFGQFLEKKQVCLSRTLEFSSPIYRLELGMVGRLFAQDPTLYSEIIFASEERRKLLKEFVVSVTENLEMLEKGDKIFFQKQFHKIAKWFGPFSEQAMRESSFLIDKLIARF